MSVRSSLFPSNALRKRARFAATIGAFALVSACASDQPGIAGPSSIGDASRGGVPAAVLASPGWQEMARILVAGANLNALAAGRAYPLLGVAQYIAVQRAEEAQGTIRERPETDRGAVAGASVAVLSYLFPTKVESLEEMVKQQLNTPSAQSHAAFATGEAIGRAVGAEMVARGTADGFGTANAAIAPLGLGFWTSSTTPATLTAGGQLPGMARWFLTSANQFRPGPPPTFGSTEFNAALAEIRQISDTRTDQQIQIATFWAFNPGTATPPGFWLDQASKEVAAHRLSEREATHVFALVSSTMADALVGCWDAKLTYWFIRPWNADAGITTLAAVGRPNHPSYPSGHSCVSSSAAEVLSMFFPERRADLSAMVTEAGLSRMYAGIHYRFDIEAGQKLGRSVALFAIAADASGSSVLSR
jgi:membrane-associated phospholipid phosphatase